MKESIAWFAQNRVAANLLMLVLIVAGLITIPTTKMEVFPEFSTDLITIAVPYPGAAPEEVEEGVCVRIEEQIQGITGIKRITSNAAEGAATVTVELLTGTDLESVMDEVKSRVDAIDTFPEDIESPVIQELLLRRQVITVALSGDADERSLKLLGERLRDDLLSLASITQVELQAVRPYEVSIEVSEAALRRYGLTFDDVAAAVRRSSLDLPGGSIKTEGGEILLRAKGQSYRGAEFEEITLIRRPDGTRIQVGDVARVVDGFEETDQFARFDGRSAVLVQVYRVGEQSALEISEAVKTYLEQASSWLPEGITATTWNDSSKALRSRIDLLLRNGRTGLILVVLILAVFLRLKLSFWVSLGIPISFLGTFWLLPSLDISINLMSLFAFLVVLGIVVDDAIVVGESIYAHFESGKSRVQAAIDGAFEMAVPVTFAVLTSVAAFVPLLMVPGVMGKYFRVIPLIVIPTLLFSLVESLFILPAHLSHLKHADVPSGGRVRKQHFWNKSRALFNQGLAWWIENTYRPVLKFCMSWRHLTLAICLVMLIITAGLVSGGWIQFLFLPEVEADNVSVSLTMPLGTPVEETSRAIRQLEAAAQQLQAEIDAGRPQGAPSVFRHIMASIGDQPFRGQQSQNAGGRQAFSAPHLGEVNIELLGSEERSVSSTELAERWRQLSGPIPDAVEVLFTSSLFSAGEPINIQLTGPTVEGLKSAAEELKQRLKGYSGVYDVSDSFRAGKQEIKLRIKPEAEILNLSQVDLARQVRQAFYGEEAQRILRGRDDVRVMVRYPKSERISLSNLEEMRIRTPGGDQVPFSTVAAVELGRGYSAIQRVDRRRALNVTADVDSGANPNEIIASLQQEDLPELLSRYPGLAYALEGEQREQRESMEALFRGFFLALFVIFTLMAVPLRSYMQPVLIMCVIPFGFVGAVWGHVIMGMDLSILSMFGLVALAGVVVNDSLVLVDAVNRNRRAGMGLIEAVEAGGLARFRPILLTSLTTFGGLTPLLLEESLQAKFLIPMAISLAFGVLFATFLTLILLPSLYLVAEDIKALGRILIGTQPTAGGAPFVGRS